MHRHGFQQANYKNKGPENYKKPEKINKITLKQQLNYEQRKHADLQDIVIDVQAGKDIATFSFKHYVTLSLVLCGAVVILCNNPVQNNKASDSKKGCKSFSSHGNITSELNRHLNTTSQACSPDRIEKPTQPASPTYKGYPVRDITGLATSCRQKSGGYTPGKVCKINNAMYFFKEIGFEGDDPLFSMYNFLFAENIGITVPKAKIFYEDGIFKKFNLVTKEVGDFVSARKLLISQNWLKKLMNMV